MAARLMERPALAEWIVDDSYQVIIREKEVPGEARGELQNPNFPSEVAAGEAWVGYIDLVNVGDARGQFRGRLDTITTNPFYLDPGGVMQLEVTGTGPSEFTIYAERYV